MSTMKEVFGPIRGLILTCTACLQSVRKYYEHMNREAPARAAFHEREIELLSLRIEKEKRGKEAANGNLAADYSLLASAVEFEREKYIALKKELGEVLDVLGAASGERPLDVAKRRMVQVKSG